MRDLTDALESLSSAEPVPGGGSVAALQSAMGASLLVMVCNLTLGKKRYESVKTDISRLKDHAQYLRDLALELSQRDVEAYQRVSLSLAMPKSTESELDQRRQSLQDALKGACEPPLRTMSAAIDVLEVAGGLVSIGNKSAISDVAVAAIAAGAAFRAAEFNVEINLEAISDDEWVQEIRTQVDALGSPESSVRTVSNAALSVIHRPVT